MYFSAFRNFHSGGGNYASQQRKPSRVYQSRLISRRRMPFAGTRDGIGAGINRGDVYAREGIGRRDTVDLAMVNSHSRLFL